MKASIIFTDENKDEEIMKKILLLLAALTMTLQITSCKSKKTQDDTQIVENADVEKI